MGAQIAGHQVATARSSTLIAPLDRYGRPMADEEVHELGREGVGQVKAWLEATTWIRLPYNAYEDGPRCMVVHAGGPKKYDLRGHFLGGKASRRELTVECKRYTTTGAQKKEFESFVAIAYGSTRKNILERGAWDEDFMWVTSHPFGTSDWTKLGTEKYVLEVLKKPESAAYIGTDPIDEELARQVSQRIWVLVYHQKQMAMVLSPEELNKVHAALNREGNPLWSGN